MTKKLTSFVGQITVEPAYFLFLSVHIIVDTTNTNLFLQKTCRFSETSEPDLNTPCDDEKRGILFASEMNSFYRFITLVVCALYAIIATSWSDANGRRGPLIFLPIIGEIFKAIFGCLHSYFWYWNPITAMLTNNAAEIMTGGLPIMYFAAQMYICDVSSVESRTMRMGILAATKTLADLVGNGGSGFLLHSVGFYHTYLVCLVLSITSLIMAVVFIRESPVAVEEKPGFGRIFNMVKIVDGFKVVFRRSMGKKRTVVFILLIIYTTVSFTTTGEKTVLYLYLRHKFGWEEREYSAYSLYRSFGIIIGSIFCAVVLSKRLQVHDGLIGVLAGACDTIAVLGFVFANENWHLYIVPLFDIFHGAAASVSFSFMSKFYDKSELGRLSSVVSVCLLVFPICFVVYHGIFNATLDIFPSAYFLLSVSLDTITVLLYFFAFLLSRRIERLEKMPELSAKNDEHQMLIQK